MEILVVVAIIAIMIAVALPILATHQRAQMVDDSGAQIIDFMRFANQRALSERQVMRFELTPSTDTDQGKLEVIDQNRITAGVGDDEVVRSELLPLKAQTTVNTVNGKFPLPPSPFNFLDPPFAGGKLIIWFNPDGSVTNNADTPQSMTLYFYTPLGGEPDPTFTRAITLFGPTASIRAWRYKADDDSFEEM